MVDAYVAWRETCVSVSEADQAWAAATGRGAAAAFWRYRVALDQEEAAARDYANVVRRVSGVLEPAAFQQTRRG